MLIDTHAHLDSPDYDTDREATIQRAIDAGVISIINIGVDLQSSRKVIQMAEQHESLYASVGIHPHEANSMDDTDYDALRKLAAHPKVVAIGEIGLDFYRNLSPPEVQKAVFSGQLKLARELELPVIIHCRKAHTEVLNILSQYAPGQLTGVFHCFSEDEQTAKKILDMGFYISFTGVITFKNARAAEIVKNLPLERLLLETDCPYMAPEPFRGKRNEPVYVRYVAEKIAEVKGLALQAVTQQTYYNARTLFPSLKEQSNS